MEEKISVLICENSEPLLRRYKAMLERDKEIRVVGTAVNGYEGALQAATARPNVILMDIEMEHHEAGIQASKEILLRMPDISIIILTMYDDEDLIYKAFQAGVVDYLIKDASCEEIIQAVKDAFWGKSALRPQIAKKLRREFARVKNAHESMLFVLHSLMKLTVTEMDVLKLLIEGNTRQDICDKRCVEMTTVKTQVRSILKKMGMGYTQEMVETLNSLNLTDFILNSLSQAAEEE